LYRNIFALNIIDHKTKVDFDMANFLCIRDLAESKNMTIRELSNTVGMTDSAMHALIKNGSTNTSTLEKIAQALDVPVGYFFDDTPNNITANHGSVALGNHSVAGNISLSDCQKELEHLKQLLEEKERTIQILMGKK
jgi:DNA-binding Xre family transcriptional regulator